MRDDETSGATVTEQKKLSAFGRLNEKAKRLNDVKVNVVTVIIFIACLAVLTFVATGLGYITHNGLKGFERRG